MKGTLYLLSVFGLLSSGLAGIEDLIDTEALMDQLKLFQRDHENDMKQREPAAIEGPQPSVQTNSGLVYGVPVQQGQIFFGIPYAEPPIGDLRFKNPIPYDHVDMTHNKTYQEVLMCYQIGSFLNRKEDCLILDVFVPSHVDLSDSNAPPSDRLPVMFSIHGGAFILGSGTWPVFDGRYLSEVTNTIVVTINYRLGPFGFLLLEDDEGNKLFDGNQGFKDQQLALEWVHDNIERFGGDKNQVTIMGESAGGQSVMLHLLSNESEPHFHRAIMQSNTWPNNYKTRESALNDTAMVVSFLRCGLIDQRPQVNRTCCRVRDSDFECLMQADSQQLINAMMRLMAYNLLRNLKLIDAVEPFRPYIDGVEFTKQPIELFKEGNWQKHKPIISGTNQEEMIILKYIFQSFIRTESIYRGLNDAIYSSIGENVGAQISDKYIATYAPADDEWSWLFSQQMTDIFFGCSMRALARYASLSSESTVHWYQYHHYLDGPDCQNRFRFLCGHSSHAFDLHFVYRTIEHSGLVQKEPNDTFVMNELSTYFGGFARTGDPNGGLGTPLQGDFPHWPKYEDNIQPGSPGPWVNVRISPNTNLESDYRQDMCDFLDTLGIYMQPQYPSTKPTALTPTTQNAEMTNTLVQTMQPGETTSQSMTTSGTMAKYRVHFATVLYLILFQQAIYSYVQF